jgi:uncharacterized protein YxjI
MLIENITIKQLTVSEALARLAAAPGDRNVVFNIEGDALNLAEALNIYIRDVNSEQLQTIKRALWSIVERALWTLEPVTIVADPPEDGEAA